MRRILIAVSTAALLCAGVVASLPASAAPKVTIAGAPALGLHVTAQTKSTLTLGWTAQPGEGYVFKVDGARVSNTWTATTASTRFSIKSGSHVYEVTQLLDGLDGTVTNPTPVTTTVVSTTTVTTTTVPTTTTQPTTTTTPVGNINLGQIYLSAAPGSVVVIPCGTYDDQQIEGQNVGPVTFRALTAHCVTIGGLELGTNNGSSSGNEPSNLTMDGIDVHGTIFGDYDTGPQSTGFVFENAKVSDTSNAGGAGLYLYSLKNSTIRNVEVGPICCNADGIDMAIPREGAPSPDGIVLDNVNVHDVYDSCTIMAKALPGVACSGLGFEDPACNQCSHVDGTQWYGGLNSTIENSTFTRINPGGNTAQGIFFAQANGGLASNLTLTGNTLGATANNDVSISGPGRSWVSGFVNISGNHVDGNIRLYGDSLADAPFAPGVKITVTGNTANVYQTTLNNGCDLILGDGSQITPVYSGNVFGNGQCQG